MSSHSMDLDSPGESVSMSVDIDDCAVSCHHRDSTKMNSPGPSGRRMQSDFHPQTHQIVGPVQSSILGTPSHPPPDHERPSGLDGSPQVTIPPSPPPPPPSPMYHLREVGDINQNHGRARQRRGITLRLDTSVREVPSRKRKRTHDSPHTHIMDHDRTQDNDTFTDGVNSQSSRRIRPRLWTQRDREFSPLLYMPPRREGDLHVEVTISTFHYPQNVTGPSHSIQRYSYPGNLHEHDPARTPQSSSSPSVNDLEDPKKRRRSDSTNSLAEIALASVVAPNHGRLSTLQDLWLPRPFEETERSSVGIVKVHERGLEAGLSFLSTNSRRTGGPKASYESAGSPMDTLGHPVCEYGVDGCSSPSVMLPLHPSSTNFFDKPICDSPDSIDYYTFGANP